MTKTKLTRQKICQWRTTGPKSQVGYRVVNALDILYARECEAPPPEKITEEMLKPPEGRLTSGKEPAPRPKTLLEWVGSY